MRVAWRRLDGPGRETCVLEPVAAGWRLTGAVDWEMDGVAAALAYRVTCDADWRSVAAQVRGWAGERVLSLDIMRVGEGWTVDGARRPDLDGCEDVDLGFTPATNTCAIRRLRLAPGVSARPVALWLDAEAWTVAPLAQSYERTGDRRYAFCSQDHGFAAELVVDGEGLVVAYPGLFARSDGSA